MHAMIQIPQPCAADWNTMSPDGKGRFCGQCCKTVIDFTKWNNRDILAYLKQHTGTCGRFRNDQLNVPIPAPDVFIAQLNRSVLPLARKAAAVLLFVFCIMGASCGTSSTPAGLNPQHHPGISAIQQAHMGYLTGDTVAPAIQPNDPESQRLMGEPAMVPDTGTLIPEPVFTTGGAPVLADPEVFTVPDTTGVQ